MIEIIEGLPDKVIGIVVSGRVTDQDRDRILLPALKKKLLWHTHPRLYVELKSTYPGPLWDDLTVGLEPLPRWQRVAIVTESSSVRDTVMMLRLIVPGQLWAFAASEAPEALAWITEGLPPEFLPSVFPPRPAHPSLKPRRKWSASHRVGGKPLLTPANDVL